ncbi:hypothetical protein GGR58DRAFT_519072 [Xylaria digitata]|nr:hypothetical protein GGR58DRAFT_519072 [Xylaria digitata]
MGFLVDDDCEALALSRKHQMKVTSEWLGCYPTMHMVRVLPWSERSELVLDAPREEDKDKRQKILHKLFDGYAAICDFPGVAFTDDLMDMYPTAKIILNQRASPLQWAQSIDESLMFFNSWTYRITTFLSKADRLHVKIHLAAFAYTRYNDLVRDEAHKRGRRVLEWEPQDGWAPICEFLGKPLPPISLPFPHCNGKEEMQKLKIILVARGLCYWALLCTTVCVLVRFLLQVRWL